MTMEDFASAHQRYLAAYRRSEIEVWCSNPECGNHGAPQTVIWETEYGQGWCTPEECPRCHHEWQEEQPQEEEDE
jgi:hypothetical protein